MKNNPGTAAALGRFLQLGTLLLAAFALAACTRRSTVVAEGSRTATLHIATGGAPE